MDTKELIKDRKFMAVIILATTVIQAALLIFIVFDSFSYFYIFRELLALVANLLFLVIPIEIIAYCVIHYRCKKGGAKSERNVLTLHLMTVASCVLFIFSTASFTQGRTVNGYSAEIQKITENEKYYIITVDDKIKIDKELYDQVVAGEPYVVTYYKNDFLKLTKLNSIQNENGEELCR